MKTTIEKWSIKKLYANLNVINDQPLYQRGKVWSKMKNQLLIDSILRGIDIPKIYLHKINYNGYNYEVADGQQRINAINLFLEDKLVLASGFVNGLQLSLINDINVEKKKLSDLKNEYPNFAKLFEEDYVLTIAIIDETSNSEVRTLFGRLQEGSKLNPAEKRNAILSPIGTHIDNFVFNHLFFESCKISPLRFRHQDYLAHAFALVIYKNKHDLKGNLLEKLYLDKVDIFPINFIRNVSMVLDKMIEVNSYSKVKIKNKFSFIDIFYFLYKNLEQIDEIDVKIFAKCYDNIEQKRIEHRNMPEILIDDKFWGKDMYQYIIAYQSLGYETHNINVRFSALGNLFNKFKK